MRLGAPAAILDKGHNLERADWGARESHQLEVPATIMPALNCLLADCFHRASKAATGEGRGEMEGGGLGSDICT